MAASFLEGENAVAAQKLGIRTGFDITQGVLLVTEFMG
jgi:hypothetical protein